MRRLLALAAVALVAAAPNWSSTVTQAPNGAYVLGNPKAKVRFVEYLSYTCSHCAHFVEESAAPLKNGFVAKGTVAVEVRNAVRDPFDMTAAMLARCGGAAKFFGNSEAIMARQAVWMADANLLLTRDGAKFEKATPIQRMQMIANGTDLGAIMKSRGFTQPQINACLSNAATQKLILGMTNEAFKIRKIGGTPYFLVNGKPGPASDKWNDVESALRSAGAGQ